MARVDLPRRATFRMDWKPPFSQLTKTMFFFCWKLTDSTPGGSISPARKNAEITASGIPPGACPCGAGVDFFRSLGMSGGRSPAASNRLDRRLAYQDMRTSSTIA